MTTSFTSKSCSIYDNSTLSGRKGQNIKTTVGKQKRFMQCTGVTVCKMSFYQMLISQCKGSFFQILTVPINKKCSRFSTSPTTKLISWMGRRSDEDGQGQYCGWAGVELWVGRPCNAQKPPFWPILRKSKISRFQQTFAGSPQVQSSDTKGSLLKVYSSKSF